MVVLTFSAMSCCTCKFLEVESNIALGSETASKSSGSIGFLGSTLLELLVQVESRAWMEIEVGSDITKI